MKRVLILGDGLSRLKFIDYINKFEGEVWGCNYSFTENSINRKFTLLGSAHKENVQKAKVYKKLTGLNFKYIYFKKYHAWNTGAELLNKALEDGYTEIQLIGFDSLRGVSVGIYSPKTCVETHQENIKEVLNKFKIKNVDLLNEIVLIRR